MKLQLDTETKELIILEEVVKFDELHKTLIKLVGKRDAPKWNVIVKRETITQWYPYWGSTIYYNYPLTGTVILDNTNVTITNCNNSTSNAISTGTEIGGTLFSTEDAMNCSFDKEGSLTVNGINTLTQLKN